jgi:hypothetical protein
LEFRNIFKPFIYSISLIFCYYLINGSNLGLWICIKIGTHLSFNSVLIWAAGFISRLNHTRCKAQIHSGSLFKNIILSQTSDLFKIHMRASISALPRFSDSPVNMSSKIRAIGSAGDCGHLPPIRQLP